MASAKMVNMTLVFAKANLSSEHSTVFLTDGWLSILSADGNFLAPKTFVPSVFHKLHTRTITQVNVSILLNDC